MKLFIVSVIMLLIIILMFSIYLFYLSDLKNNINSQISILEDINNSENSERALKQLSSIKAEWEKNSGILFSLNDHSNLVELGKQLEEAEHYIESDNFDDAGATIKNFRYLFNYVINSNMPHIENIL